MLYIDKLFAYRKRCCYYFCSQSASTSPPFLSLRFFFPPSLIKKLFLLISKRLFHNKYSLSLKDFNRNTRYSTLLLQYILFLCLLLWDTSVLCGEKNLGFFFKDFYLFLAPESKCGTFYFWLPCELFRNRTFFLSTVWHNILRYEAVYMKKRWLHIIRIHSSLKLYVFMTKVPGFFFTFLSYLFCACPIRKEGYCYKKWSSKNFWKKIYIYPIIKL